jgi:hypothetical protein
MARRPAANVAAARRYSRNAPDGDAAQVMVPALHSPTIIFWHWARADPERPAQFALITARQACGLHVLDA